MLSNREYGLKIERGIVSDQNNEAIYELIIGHEER